MDVNYEEGEVVTHLNHHKSGNTKLARDVFSLNLLVKILHNPRVHTDTGRHVGHLYAKENDPTASCSVISSPCTCNQSDLRNIFRQILAPATDFQNQQALPPTPEYQSPPFHTPVYQSPPFQTPVYQSPPFQNQVKLLGPV